MPDLTAAQVRRILARSSFFSPLPAAALEHVISFSRRRTLREGETLFHRGDDADAVYVILAGRLRVVSPGSDGREVALRIQQGGEIIGELSILHGGRRTATVVASEPCELLAVVRREFLGLIEQHPPVALGLLTAFAARIAELTEQLSDFALHKLPVRLARRLLDLSQIYGQAAEEGLRIAARITQQDLAVWVGTTREAVNKHLRAWEDRGLIRLDRESLTILRPPELARLAGEPIAGEEE